VQIASKSLPGRVGAAVTGCSGVESLSAAAACICSGALRDRSVYAICPQSRYLPAKLRAILDHLVDHFEPGADRMIVTAWERRWREHAARGQPVALRYWIL
jgi:hypothetical protein